MNSRMIRTNLRFSHSNSEIPNYYQHPDLLYGYDLTLKDNTFDPEIAGLIEGGVVKKANGVVTGYRSPMLSEGASKMKSFRAQFYIANYEGDSIKNYVKMTCNNCSGTAPSFSGAKEFYAPEFTIKAREATRANLPIKSMEYVDELPAAPQPEILSISIGTLEEGSITNIPSATTVAQLLNATYASFGASKKVVDASGNDKETGAIIATDKLVVYILEDEENKKEYTLALSE